MVAVVNAVSTNGVPPVTVVAGEEASGLARIVCQYLEQLLADSPAKRAEAAALRGRLGLHAREGDVAITVVFGDGGIAIEEGLREPDAVMTGEVEFLMHILAGRANPAWELARRRLATRVSPRRPLFGHQAYHLMRLPDVRLWSGLPRPPLGLGAGAAVAMTLSLVLWRTSRQAQGGDDA